MNHSNRAVNFELLRILAMFGVVMNHVFNYGLNIYDDFSVDTSTFSGLCLWSVLELMKLVALPSVNCYILITGYFLIDKIQFRLRGIWKVWFTTWFYAVGIYILSVIFDWIPFSWSELLNHATPLISNNYWFVTSYIILMMLAPLIALLMKRVTKRQYEVVLAIGCLICFQPFLGHILMDQQQVLLFVYLFLIGGYIRRYYENMSIKGIYLFMAYFGILMLMYGYMVFKNEHLQNENYVVYAMAYHSMVLPLSVFLFLWVKGWQINSKPLKKCILWLAPLSFAVYIIHTQSVVHPFLWSGAQQLLSNVNDFVLPLVCILIALAVFITGISIDYIRQRLFLLFKKRK